MAGAGLQTLEPWMVESGRFTFRSLSILRSGPETRDPSSPATLFLRTWKKLEQSGKGHQMSSQRA